MFNLSKSVYHYQRMYGKEAKGTAKTVPQIAAERFSGDKSLQEDCKRYVLACGVKPSGNTKELLRQFIAVKNARAKKYAEDNFCGPEHACNFDEPMAKALGQRAGIVQLAADHFDFGNAAQQTAQGAATGGIFGAALGALNSILSGLSGRRWTGEEKDFAKLYMSITGRTKFDNNATVGANGQAAGGEPIEYTQHIPEAATYFTLKYGKPITDRASALAAIGETWTPGLWGRIYGRDANTWENVFKRNGL